MQKATGAQTVSTGNSRHALTPPNDVPDPIIKVLEVGGPATQVDWKISQNLTDRWGEINDYDAENKPLELLRTTPGLLDSLIAQMWDEVTFVARKDGQFGLLYEVEYCSIESETEEGQPEPHGDYKPHATVVAALLKGMLALAQGFPGVTFAVPDENEIVKNRPAAWAFVPDGLLDGDQRRNLGLALLSL